ncbi:UNVERIFIED_CONTAM: hypothetical protein GTU68_048832 [Idotea baltica]|nr:hypothetical protein [Idotea baltica]
MLIFYCI